MARFRSAASQAQYAISQRLDLSSRHDNKDDGQIHSLGTARNYEQALTGFAEFLQENRIGDLQSATTDQATQYLTERAETVSQKTLDLNRQALQVHLGEKLERVKSELETNLSTRAYTAEQIERIAGAQNERNGLATEIAAAAGLRAHELLTIRPADERPAAEHRQWREDRFEGREGERYTVEGKGGLIREVMIPSDLAGRLEERRLENSERVADRGVIYERHYDIGGGHAWSQSFSAASSRELGWSTGAHGVRHTYAQERMSELQGHGYSYDEAKSVVAQEVGHFSSHTTEAYLR